MSINQSLCNTNWKIFSITQHNYQEQYVFQKEHIKIQQIFTYNGKYEFILGTHKILSGTDEDLYKLLKIIKSKPIIIDQTILNAVNCFNTFLNKYHIEIINVIEHQYKAFIIISHANMLAELELNIPAKISQKGIISSIKVRKTSHQEFITYLRALT